MKTFPMMIAISAGLVLSGATRLQGQDAAAQDASLQQQQAMKAAQEGMQLAQEETKRAMEQARAEVDRAQTQVKKQVAEAVALSANPPVPAGGEFSYRLQNLINRASGGAGANNKPLVIQTSNPDAQEQANLEEDLAVMAHLLEKALEDVPGASWRGGFPRAMGIDVFVGSGPGAMRNLYLDGYGALFVVNVGFPLIPPAAKTGEEKPAGDSAWEEAKQELYGQGPGMRPPPPPGEEFSPEKVSKLKASLLEALKNATNIRGIRPDESITVCVLGGTSTGAFRVRTVARAGAGGGGGGTGGFNTFTRARGPGQGTVMTIRVKKADVDAYAKGSIDREEFQKRARVTTYTASANSGTRELGWMGGVGGGIGGGSAFGGSGGSAELREEQ